jgi:hypothetical protein
MNHNNTLPDNWERKEEYLNGNAKLVAKYKNPETGETHLSQFKYPNRRRAPAPLARPTTQ